MDFNERWLTIGICLYIGLVALILLATGCTCLENCPAQGNMDCGNGVKADKYLRCPGDPK